MSQIYYTISDHAFQTGQKPIRFHFLFFFIIVLDIFGDAEPGDFSGQIEPCLGLSTGLGTVAKAPKLFDIFDTNIYLAISAR
jgi:hypothetical protein